MSDLIDRQAVLDLIADYDLSMGQVVRGIHALPSVTPQQKTGRWIPVSEEKPRDGQFILAAYPELNGGMIATRYKSYRGCTFKAWMPLPEPYKAESEE